MPRRLLPALLATLGLTAPAAAAEVSYAKDVKPFLAKYCVECHKADKAHGGVALDSYAVMRQGNDPVVIPGQPDKSDLVRVLATSSRKRMPPRDATKRPTAEEIALVRAWVAAGARDDSEGAGEEAAEPARAAPARRRTR
jgi:mono/diheme cytochrome c family protein